MTSRNYCFTAWKKPVMCEHFRYLIYGEEICPKTGNIHWQSYVEFFNKVSIKKLKIWLNDDTLHAEVRKGSREQARHYCMKDDKYEEFGDWDAGGQGARTDLKKLFKRLENGETNYDIINSTPEIFNKFQRFISQSREAIEEEKQARYKKKFESEFKPNPMQAEVINRLEKQDSRKILWVTDTKGNSGKTHLAKYLLSRGGLYLTNAKCKDISYAFKGQKTVVFDFTRSTEGSINYSAIEMLKNGVVFNSKYKSESKIFEPPAILCLANFNPNMMALSLDRWHVYKISEVGNTDHFEYGV